MRFGRRKVPVLAEVAPPPLADLGGGALRRADLEAFGALLGRLPGVSALQATGDAGKHAVAVGLATAAAAAGRRTALLECDLARPALARALGLAADPGLHEYLRRGAEAPEILQALVLAGPASGGAAEPLACIVAGQPTSHGSTLLASEAFGHALGRLRSGYELVVVDGPPLVDERAVAAVAAQVDATLSCAPEVPRGLRDRVDGLVVPSPGGPTARSG